MPTDDDEALVRLCFIGDNWTPDDTQLVIRYLDAIYLELGGNGLVVVGEPTVGCPPPVT
jgi:hypothetical protein